MTVFSGDHQHGLLYHPPMALYLYRIEPAREGMPDAPTADEQRLVGEHFEYLSAAHEQGIVKYAGRTLSAPHLGMALFEATDDAAAAAFLAGDPAVQAGIFRGLAQPFREIFSRLPSGAGDAGGPPKHVEDVS